LYHQLLALRGELPDAYGSGIELASQLGVPAVGFPKIYLSLSRAHPLSPFVGFSLRHQAGRKTHLMPNHLTGWHLTGSNTHPYPTGGQQ
jgi:hypothetical protein